MSSIEIDSEIVSLCHERRLVMDNLDATLEEMDSVVQRELASGEEADLELSEPWLRMDALQTRREEIDARIGHLVMLRVIGCAA